MRKCHVEIEKTVNTQWPPDSVQHGGKTHDLVGIYTAAGFELDVKKGSASLALPSTGANFDLAQLHRFMIQHRSPPAMGWHAHILVVPNIRYISGWRTVQPIGVMYDSRSADENNTPREGCAMSFRAVAALDERAYLRTLAHELGHTFNLAHPKHDRPPRPISTKIMNQTGDLQSLGNFPDNISYEFEDHAKRWLQSAPTEFVRPGGRPFGSQPTDALEQLAGDMGEPTTEGLEFTASTRHESYGLGEPMYLRFSLRNAGAGPLDVPPEISLHNQTVHLEIVDPLNRTRTFRPTYVACLEEGVVSLAPGLELLGNSAAFLDAYGQVFSSPGNYKLLATYSSSAGGRRLVARAKPVEIEIRVPASGAELALADEMSAPDMGLYIVLGGGSHLPRAAKAWRKIVQANLDAPFAQAAKVALAQGELSAHPGKAAGQRALKLLATADLSALDYEQVAEQAQAKQIAASRLGRKKAAQLADAELRAAAEAIDPTAGAQLDQA